MASVSVGKYRVPGVKDEHDRLQSNALANNAGVTFPFQRIGGSRVRCLSCPPGTDPTFPADDDSLELHVGIAHTYGAMRPALREVA